MTTKHNIEQLSCEVRGNKLLNASRATATSAPSDRNENCLYSRPNISFLIALTVSYGFLIAFPSLRASILVSADSAATTGNKAISSYLLYSSPSSLLPEKSSEQIKLEKLLKDTNHNHASDTISLKLANDVWARMHQRVESYAHDRAELVRPSVEELMGRASVGRACRQSILTTIDHLAKLDEWAVRMYNAFGNFPAGGFFEGTHTSMGSYHQCVNVEPNEWIGKPQYCTLKFQPIIPKRPRYHNILATIDNLANFTSKNDVSIVVFDRRFRSAFAPACLLGRRQWTCSCGVHLRQENRISASILLPEFIRVNTGMDNKQWSQLTTSTPLSLPSLNTLSRHNNEQQNWCVHARLPESKISDIPWLGEKGSLLLLYEIAIGHLYANKM